MKAGTQFWRDWVIANAVGELLGLGIAAVVIMIIYRAHPANPSGLIVLASALTAVLFGAYEGAVVGYAQWIVLRRRLQVAARSWVIATTVTATAAWALGMAPSTIMTLTSHQPGQPMPEPGPLLTLLLSAGLGIVSSRAAETARDPLAPAKGIPRCARNDTPTSLIIAALRRRSRGDSRCGADGHHRAVERTRMLA